MDEGLSNMLDHSAEHFEHLAVGHIASSRPRFTNPLDLINLNGEQGVTFDLDEFDSQEDLFDCEEEVYDQDILANFAYSAPEDDSEVVDKEREGTNNADHFRMGRPLQNFTELESTMTALTENNTVFKSVLVAGGDTAVPERSKVYFHYEAFHEECRDPFDTSLVRKYPYVVDLRRDPPIPGLEIALKSMKVSEVARFIFYPKMAYGVQGCPPRIPPNSKILYVVQLLQFIGEKMLNTPEYMTNDERSVLPFSTIYETSLKLRTEANGFYKSNIFWSAIKMWRKAANMVEDYPVTASIDESARNELLGTLYANLAQGYLKLNRPAQACSACKLGLRCTNGIESFKLLFRFAKAKLMFHDYKAAMDLVRQCKQLNPDSNSVKTLEREIKEESCKSDDLWRGKYKPPKENVPLTVLKPDECISEHSSDEDEKKRVE